MSDHNRSFQRDYMHIIRNVFRMIKVYTTIGENTQKKVREKKIVFPNPLATTVPESRE